MTNCDSCEANVPEGAEYCSNCGAAQKSAGPNPYQASEAVIDAGPLAPVGFDDDGYEYNVPFGVGATIGETFNAWFNSLGQMVLISLIPFIPGIVFTLVGVGVLVSVVVKKFPALMEDFNIDRLADLFGGIGVGVFVMIAVFVLILMVCTIPAFMGQFRIMDEKTKHGMTQSSIWQTYIAGFKFVLPIFGFVILMYIAMILLVLPAGLLAFVPALAVIYVIAMLVVISFLAIRFSVVLPLMVIEGLPLFVALGRSNEMVMGRTWTVMGIYGVFLAVMMGISFGIGVVGLIPILGQIAGVAAQLLLAPLQAAVMFAIYAGLKSPQTSF